MKYLLTTLALFSVLLSACGDLKGSKTSDELAKLVFECVKKGDIERIMSVTLDEKTAKIANEITGRNFTVEQIKQNWLDIMEGRQKAIDSFSNALLDYRKAIIAKKPITHFVRYKSSTREDHHDLKLSEITIYFESSSDPEFNINLRNQTTKITAIKIKEKWLLLFGDRFEEAYDLNYTWSEKDESERQKNLVTPMNSQIEGEVICVDCDLLDISKTPYIHDQSHRVGVRCYDGSYWIIRQTPKGVEPSSFNKQMHRRIRIKGLFFPNKRLVDVTELVVF